MRNVGAVILAAGGSTRLGQPKQLLVIEGETLVRRIVNAATEAGCARVVAVVGELRERIAAELRGTRAEVVENDEWQRGLGTSIKRGVGYIVQMHPEVDGVVLLTCDQPFVNGAVIRALIDERERSGNPIVASNYGPPPFVTSTEAETSLKDNARRDSSASVGMTKAGVPALFHRVCFEALLSLPDDSGAKLLIEADLPRVSWIEFPDGTIDIDTPADLERFRAAN